MIRLVARRGDLVFCAKHGLGKIDPADRQVLVNGLDIAAVGDPCPCLAVDINPSLTQPVYAVPNKLMAGIYEVIAAGRPVAAILHAAQHNIGSPDTGDGPAAKPNGFVLIGSANVLVSGNTVVGDVADSVAACMAAAMTRGGPGVRNQSFQNCGLGATRQLVNGYKQPGDPGYVDESQWFNQQVAAGNADVPVNEKSAMDSCRAEADAQVSAQGESASNPSSQNSARQASAEKAYQECLGRYRANAANGSRSVRNASGGTSADQRNATTAGTSAETTNGECTARSAADACAQGNGVVMPMNGMPMNNDMTSGQHIVVVAGVVVDDDGKPVTVIYNDPLNGCGVTMDAGTFNDKTQNARSNVTKKPIW